MRFLSLMSLFGLMIFVLFTSVGQADVFNEPVDRSDEEWSQQEEIPVEPSERHFSHRQKYHRSHEGSVRPRPYPQPQPPITYPPNHPYPGPGYGQVACNIAFIGFQFGNPVYNLFVGNRLMQTGVYGVVRNSAYYYMRLGHCYLGNIR